MSYFPEYENNYSYISTNGTFQVKTGPGVLVSIINNDNTGAALIYDNTISAAPIIANFDLARAVSDNIMNINFTNGLRIVTSGGARITVIYR